ncbi:hypothetical protein BS47DRAFT_127552 [Hydnum rufescens UP504]|uniref:Meiotic nuclear division protein 1 n=1 Tax=Hydnum rufescens UP504 TaxID=1448309 RepID=A0A9P6AQV2_9AGAM|nr:hypothetical protein BS47DRAFT_127552 [Hydnum rufescens UP504]
MMAITRLSEFAENASISVNRLHSNIVTLQLLAWNMAGGRGLSVEEKRAKLLEIFRESKDFFQLKELEKLGAKKGVVSQTVKEILQSLVDDNLVQFDKIGSANFYWSFPSARGSLLTHQIETTHEELSILEARQSELISTIEISKSEREDSSHRNELLATYSALQESLAAAKMELARYQSSNAGQYEEKQRAVILAKEAAVRWNDNIEFAIAHCVSTFNMTTADIRNAFEIPDTLEDLPAD